MQSGTGVEAVLRDNRKVVFVINSFVFLVSNPFAALVSKAVFLCPANSGDLAPTGHFRLP